MTGNTHRIITLHAMDRFEMEPQQRRDFLRGNVLADFLPHYNYRRHYPRQAMEYVLDMNKTVDAFFELGVLSHFLCDFVCTPHFHHWRLYSLDALKHLRFEKNLERVASGFDFAGLEVKKNGSGCINDRVLNLYRCAGEDYPDNLRSGYAVVCSMLDRYLKH